MAGIDVLTARGLGVTAPAEGLAHPLIAYFGHDGRESAVHRRIASLQAAGARVLGFTFLRRDQNERGDVAFPNVPLGVTVDRHYGRRLLPLALGLGRALARWRDLRAADLIIARNLDMLALAALARRLTGARGRLVYEVLDVQRVFTGQGRSARAMRAAERRLLREADLLLVSSPDFITFYFAPVQGYTGPWHLLENKLSAHQAGSRAAPLRPPAPPWVIGWFGVLRCRRSLEALAALADALGPLVRIVVRGRLSREDISQDMLDAVVAARANMSFEGPYRSPEDLAAIYGEVHFIWSLDYTDAGGNSDWLLPNRIYEGGYHGAVALARAGTATGRLVEARGLGIAFAEPAAQTIGSFLRGLDAEAYEALRAPVLQAPAESFRDDHDVQLFLRRAMGPQDPASGRPDAAEEASHG